MYPLTYNQCYNKLYMWTAKSVKLTKLPYNIVAPDRTAQPIISIVPILTLLLQNPVSPTLNITENTVVIQIYNIIGAVQKTSLAYTHGRLCSTIYWILKIPKKKKVCPLIFFIPVLFIQNSYLIFIPFFLHYIGEAHHLSPLPTLPPLPSPS